MPVKKGKCNFRNYLDFNRKSDNINIQRKIFPSFKVGLD